jgi:lysophospholipase L1-like esterase
MYAKISFILIFITIVILIVGYSFLPKNRNNKATKIMPLGASRVEGNVPDYESFRYYLWKKLIWNGYTVDFIGTNKENAQYPKVNNISFDRDHEGWSGWTSKDIHSQLKSWLNEIEMPDIVLFSSPGGNDALEGLPFKETVSNVNSIIEVLQNSNPNIIIIIEQMAPAHSDYMTSDLVNYINSLNQEMLKIAKNHSTKTSKVITIDMYSGFKDDYLADDVHYNKEGAKHIANKYYKILSEILSSE